MGANVGRAQPAVSIELALLVDISGSVSPAEFLLQQTGYKNAFNDNAFWTAFASSGRTLAVTMTQWSTSSLQISGGTNGWYLITDATSAANFATAIGNFTRCTTCGANTGVGDAMNFGRNLLGLNYTGARKVIDVSGDGANNVGSSAALARDAAQAAGITVNGLAILGEAGLEAWYNNNVRTTDGFVEASNGFDDFDRAIARKIGREINVVPEPSTYLLMASGLMVIAIIARRRRSA